MRTFHILNLGAGVQSTALYLLGLDGRFQFDVAIFADTGEEPSAVYRHLDHLRTLAGPPIIVRQAGRLGDDLRNGRGPTRRFVSIPAFTRSREGKIGIVPRQCTAEYKIEVVERTIRRDVLGLQPRQQIPRDVQVFQYFGISIDEAGRAVRGRRRFEGRRDVSPVYPLIDLAWTRSDCVAYLAKRLTYPAPRSACVFCPYRSEAEWQRLKQEDSDGWQRAIEIDRILRSPDAVCTRSMRQPMFLHRSCVPLDQVRFSEFPIQVLHPMTVGECEGMCGV